MTSSVVIVSLLVLVAANTGNALKCWVCSSNVFDNCRDPFNSTRVTIDDCERSRTLGSMDYAACQKLVETINDGQSRVIRKCVFTRHRLEGGCAEPPPTMNFLKREHCSTCETDTCNTASPTTLLSLITHTLLLLLITVFI